MMLALSLSVGCTLHARQFLPATGHYILTSSEGRLDSGWEVPILIVTDEDGPVAASVRLSSVDGGSPSGAGFDDWMQSTAVHASVIRVNPQNGRLENARGAILMPEPVVVGARWQIRDQADSACFVEEEVVSVTDRVAQIAHRFACENDRPTLFMNSTWEVGAGETEFRTADGGAGVRLIRLR
ncbi:MAG: hypothetical protein ABTQ32_31275 [Myxococcaceae bacterium]